MNLCICGHTKDIHTFKMAVIEEPGGGFDIWECAECKCRSYQESPFSIKKREANNEEDNSTDDVRNIESGNGV